MLDLINSILKGIITFLSNEIILELISNIIVGVLAFVGVCLGIRRIKKQLIDDYIEKKITQTQQINDKVLIKSRDVLASFEQSYTENKNISEDELDNIIKTCSDLSRTSEDAGKEVSTIAYLLYKTVKDLKPIYNHITKNEKSYEILTLSDVINLVSSSLHLIIYYCTNSIPIPSQTKLQKRSLIKQPLRKYLNDKGFYSLKDQPFGLTLNPTSEVILTYSEIVGNTKSSIFSRNLFLFLRNNVPLAYQMMSRGIYVPLIINKKEEDFLLGNPTMHLIKIKKIKRIGEKNGDFIEFYYSNISPSFYFVDNLDLNSFQSEFINDVFLDKQFKFNNEEYELSKKLQETIKVTISLEVAKENFKKNRSVFERKLRTINSHYKTFQSL
ncbi:hypothetical protein [Picosynechococcus sp. NKBG15041c]|uniref:hypothetical protein n=1 Tax=Picosynechococcus sp. NKBG15041c TaxID=1407650 RepID=UPI00041485A6|nr:hypothetical protein [Picosynechococcus sp. NKBG15041c]